MLRFQYLGVKVDLLISVFIERESGEWQARTRPYVSEAGINW